MSADEPKPVSELSIEELEDEAKALLRTGTHVRNRIAEIDAEIYEKKDKPTYEALVGKCFGYELQQRGDIWNLEMRRIDGLLPGFSRTFIVTEIVEQYANNGNMEKPAPDRRLFYGMNVGETFAKSPEDVLLTQRGEKLEEVSSDKFDKELKRFKSCVAKTA